MGRGRLLTGWEGFGKMVSNAFESMVLTLKKYLSFLLALCLTVSLAAPSARAADGVYAEIPDWALEAYLALSKINDGAHYIGGNGPIGRSYFAMMLVDLLKYSFPKAQLDQYPAVPSDYFADTPHHATPPVIAGFGIMDGRVDDDGTRYFMPDDPLTREQAAKTMVALLDFVSDKLGYPLSPAGEPMSYTDADSISPWAAESAQAIAAYGLMQGDQEGRFTPQAQLTYASANVLVYRTMELLLPVALEGIQQTVCQSQQDWSQAARFGRNSGYEVSQPTRGRAEGYYTIDNGDGTLSGLVVNFQAEEDRSNYTIYPIDNIAVERFDAQGELVSTITLAEELPLFGAFFDSGEHFYVAYGQPNEDKDDSLEVLRVVQYDREWKRLGAVSVKGRESYTIYPFCATTSRMAVSGDGDTVALYTARQRYDGHQSNLTVLMDTDSFHIQKVMGGQYPDNHVSHSFGQFIRFDGDKMVTVDHGDAYPRSFVLQAGSRELDLLKIHGKIGDNVTHAIGSGLEVSDEGYLFLGCSGPQDGTDGAPLNVFLAYTGKDARHSELTWLTQSETDIDRARLVKVNGDTFVAMWAQEDGLHYQLLDGKGSLVGEEQVLKEVPMPPTDPVVLDGDICWLQYVSHPLLEGRPLLYRISLSSETE